MWQLGAPRSCHMHRHSVIGRVCHSHFSEGVQGTGTCWVVALHVAERVLAVAHCLPLQLHRRSAAKRIAQHKMNRRPGMPLYSDPLHRYNAGREATTFLTTFRLCSLTRLLTAAGWGACSKQSKAIRFTHLLFTAAHLAIVAGLRQGGSSRRQVLPEPSGLLWFALSCNHRCHAQREAREKERTPHDGQAADGC